MVQFLKAAIVIMTSGIFLLAGLIIYKMIDGGDKNTTNSNVVTEISIASDIKINAISAQEDTLIIYDATQKRIHIIDKSDGSPVQTIQIKQ